MEKKRRDGISYKVFFALSIVFVMVAIFVVSFFFIFNKKERYDSTVGQDIDSISVLHCKIDNISGAFFEPEYTDDYFHEIKVAFFEDETSGVSYNYYGVYESKETADIDNSKFHADYNIYLGDNGVYQESLYPAFSIIGNDVKINLYADEESFNSVTARFFFLDDAYHNLHDFDRDYLMDLYTNKGFSCSFNESEI